MKIVQWEPSCSIKTNGQKHVIWATVAIHNVHYKTGALYNVMERII